MKEFNLPNDNFIQEEIVNSESEISSDNLSDKEKMSDIDIELAEIEKHKEEHYDQPASKEEIAGLKEGIEKKIEKKAKELKIPKEKLIELANLDLESLDKKNLESLNLNQGGLEFIRDSIDSAVNEYWRSKETDNLVMAAPSSIDKLLKFVREHKKLVSLSELAIYASSFGPAVLKDLAGDGAQVEIGKQKFSLKYLADNPELINEIEASYANNPKSISQEYFSKPLVFENSQLSIDFSEGNYNETTGERAGLVIIDFRSLADYKSEHSEQKKEEFNTIKKELKQFGFESFYIELNDFEENKEEIVKIISSNTNIPEKAVLSYINNILEINTSKISIVEFEDFKIYTGEYKSDVTEKYEKIMDKYDTTNPREKNEAINEFEEWGEKNNYEDIWASLKTEQLLNSGVPLSEIIKGTNVLVLSDITENVSHEESMKEMESFNKLFTKDLEESGYNIEDLKKIAESNQTEVINIMNQIICKHIEYDYEKLKLIEENDIWNIKKQTPNDTIKSGEGVCHDYAKLFVSAKYFLEKKGVPNLDRVALLYSDVDTGSGRHAINTLIHVNESGDLIITNLDSTWSDTESLSDKISNFLNSVKNSTEDKNIKNYIDKINNLFVGNETINKNESMSEELNAVDDRHYYTGIIKKVNEAHQKALDKIKDYNLLAFQEKLKKILTEYDPKLHKRNQQIEGNEELRKTEKDIEALREEKM